jgi:spore maturation protein CgeB
MGTYSDDRQPSVERFLLQAARELPQGRFIVAGPQYPETIAWPGNVTWQSHLPPAEHRRFYNGQRFTLNVTRADMIAAGWSPSVRLFEAAACGTPILSDRWAGLDSVFTPGKEIVLVDSTAEVLAALRMGEDERLAMAQRARERILAEHTAAHRAAELEGYAHELLSGVAA